MSLKTRQLTDIASELAARYALAHVSTASALDIARAELQGCAEMYKLARANGWTEEADYQYARGCALNALCKRLAAAEIEEANALAAGAKRAA